MGFQKKTWKDRNVEFAGRRTLTKVAGSVENNLVVDVSRNEGEVSQAGDAFSAANMNDLEQRISDAIGTGEIPEELGGDIISAINSLNTGTELLNGTIITNSVTYAQNVVVNKITLSPGSWLITSHVSFTTSADAIYAHALLIGTMEGITVDGITVRNRMSGGGGTAIPYLVSLHDTMTITAIVNQSNPAVMTLESNVLRAVKL